MKGASRISGQAVSGGGGQRKRTYRRRPSPGADDAAAPVRDPARGLDVVARLLHIHSGAIVTGKETAAVNDPDRTTPFVFDRLGPRARYAD